MNLPDANILLYAYDRSSPHSADARRWLEGALSGSTPVAFCWPTERHWALLSGLLTSGQASGPLVSDAHLAALAIEHGATLVTNDRDFARFPGLDVEYPLMGA